MENYYHFPVMAREIIEGLNINPQGIYIDCTLGGGGHTRLILDKLAPQGKVIAIDRDQAAIDNAQANIKDDRLMLFRDNFCNIDSVLMEAGIECVHGIIMDLGVSSHQLDNPERGFSYIKDAPLDMRMDNRDKLSAYNVVNEYSEKELSRILYEYGEEKHSRRIVAEIIKKRSIKPIETTLELSEIINSVVPSSKGRGSGNPSKRSFQAIRIEVNDELGIIGDTIRKSVALLNKGGRIAIISFHSLEDRIVKSTFNSLVSPCNCPKDLPMCACGKQAQIKLITRKAALPSSDELELNKRSHSAKLRIAEKIV